MSETGGERSEFLDNEHSPENIRIIELPAEIDGDWVADFNFRYGRGGYWTVIESEYCLVQTGGYGDFRNGITAFSRLDLLRATGSIDTPIYGRIVGVKLMHLLQGYMETDGGLLERVAENETHPYIVLNDADLPTYPYEVTPRLDQQVMVPIGGLESLELTKD